MLIFETAEQIPNKIKNQVNRFDLKNISKSLQYEQTNISDQNCTSLKPNYSHVIICDLLTLSFSDKKRKWRYRRRHHQYDILLNLLSKIFGSRRVGEESLRSLYLSCTSLNSTNAGASSFVIYSAPSSSPRKRPIKCISVNEGTDCARFTFHQSKQIREKGFCSKNSNKDVNNSNNFSIFITVNTCSFNLVCGLIKTKCLFKNFNFYFFSSCLSWEKRYCYMSKMSKEILYSCRGTCSRISFWNSGS